MARGEGLAEDKMFDLSWPGPLKGTGVSRQERSQTEEPARQRRPRGTGGTLHHECWEWQGAHKARDWEHLLFESAVFL